MPKVVEPPKKGSFEEAQKLFEETKKEREGNPNPDSPKNLTEYLQRFSGPQTQTGSPNPTEEEKPRTGAPKAQEPPKKGGFIESLKQKNKELEQNLTEQQKRFEQEKTELTAKLNEFEKKLQESSGSAETQSLLTQREKELKEIQDRYNETEKKYKELEKKDEFNNFVGSSYFKREFEESLQQIYGQVQETLGNDQDLMAEFSKAAQADAAYLQAQGDEKYRQKRVRDEILNNIAGRLDDLNKDDFRDLVGQMKVGTKKRYDALLNHEQTRQRALEHQQEINRRQQEAVMQRWGSTFKANKEKIDNETKIPEVLQSIIQSQKIDADSTMDEAIANASITDGAKDYDPSEVTRVISQGAAYKRLLATTKAQDHKIKELEETVKTLQGSSSTTGNGGGGGKSKDDEFSEKRANFFQRFTGPR